MFANSCGNHENQTRSQIEKSLNGSLNENVIHFVIQLKRKNHLRISS